MCINMSGLWIVLSMSGNVGLKTKIAIYRDGDNNIPGVYRKLASVNRVQSQ